RGVNDPTVRQAMEQLFARVERTVPHTQVVSPYTPEGARQVSENGRIAYGEINFADRPDKEFQDAADKVKAEAEDVQVSGLRIEPAVQGLAIGSALGVLMTMLAAITLLPAVLGFVGQNIDKLGLPHKKRAEGEVRESFWYRWSRFLQRRPWPVAIAGVVILVVL